MAIVNKSINELDQIKKVDLNKYDVLIISHKILDPNVYNEYKVTIEQLTEFINDGTVVSVNGMDGIVTLTASDILTSGNETIQQELTDIKSDVSDLESGTGNVIGVKGNSESAYRQGNVNLTSANIGALALTGGTLTGNLILQKSNSGLFIKEMDIDRTVVPESNISRYPITIVDKNSKILGYMRVVANSNSSTLVSIGAYKTGATNSVAQLQIGYDNAGNVYTYAPNPAKASNTTAIATTKFVKDNLADYNATAETINEIFATCSTAAATQQKVITLPSGKTLKDDDVLTVLFTNTNTFSGTADNKITFKIGNDVYDIRYRNTSDYSTGTNTGLYGVGNYEISYRVSVTNKTLTFIHKSWDNNTTYTNAALGQGYGTCATAAATVAKVVTLSNYALVINGIVAVRFTYAVPANATMNINSKGAKPIYYQNSAIVANIIGAGDTATFIYDGTNYHLISLDKGTGGTTTVTAANVSYNKSAVSSYVSSTNVQNVINEIIDETMLTTAEYNEIATLLGLSTIS